MVAILSRVDELKGTEKLWKPIKPDTKHVNFLVSTVPADGLTP